MLRTWISIRLGFNWKIQFWVLDWNLLLFRPWNQLLKAAEYWVEVIFQLPVQLQRNWVVKLVIVKSQIGQIGQTLSGVWTTLLVLPPSFILGTELQLKRHQRPAIWKKSTRWQLAGSKYTLVSSRLILPRPGSRNFLLESTKWQIASVKYDSPVALFLNTALGHVGVRLAQVLAPSDAVARLNNLPGKSLQCGTFGRRL